MIATIEEYQIRKEELRKDLFKKDFDQLKNADIKSYILTSANHDFLLGKRSSAEHQDFYREYLLSKQLHHVECATCDLGMVSDLMKIKGDIRFLEDKNSGPYIFAGFHFGSFHLEGLLLSKLQVECSVLAQNTRYMDQFKNYLSDTYSDTHGAVIQDDDIIQPFSLKSMLDVMEKLRAGKNLLCYLDGFQGVGRYSDTHKMAKLDFCGKKIFARKGIPKISHLLGVPIITMVSQRDHNGNLVTTFMPPVDPKDFSSQQEFIQSFLQGAFETLEQFFRETPEQYNILDLFHMFVESEESTAESVKPNFSEEDSMRFNAERFGIFPKKDKQFLFDKTTYHFFDISEGLANFLNALEARPYGELNQIINPTLLSDLLSRQVIVNQ